MAQFEGSDHATIIVFLQRDSGPIIGNMLYNAVSGPICCTMQLSS